MTVRPIALRAAAVTAAAALASAGLVLAAGPVVASVPDDDLCDRALEDVEAEVGDIDSAEFAALVRVQDEFRTAVEPLSDEVNELDGAIAGFDLAAEEELLADAEAGLAEQQDVLAQARQDLVTAEEGGDPDAVAAAEQAVAAAEAAVTELETEVAQRTETIASALETEQRLDETLAQIGALSDAYTEGLADVLGVPFAVIARWTQGGDNVIGVMIEACRAEGVPADSDDTDDAPVATPVRSRADFTG
ncbi:hypothetical protein [Aquipuribacter nitratireducens]|uniref:Uncharacterized protein n=1 Tax=Aquipuribacter nitratireducens TaxID=650104 RepID=A0ABW0GJV5_9MICO